MWRAILEGLALFLLPFMVFGVYLAARGDNPIRPDSWSKNAFSWVLIVSLAVCLAGVVTIGATRHVERGTFVPSTVRDGQFVPGHFR